MLATVQIEDLGPSFSYRWRVTVNGAFQGDWPTQTSAVNAVKHVLSNMLEGATV